MCDEIKILTVGGEKTTPIYKGEMQIFDGGEIRKKQVYFAVATNMLSREYKMIFSPLAFEDNVDEKE